MGPQREKGTDVIRSYPSVHFLTRVLIRPALATIALMSKTLTDEDLYTMNRQAIAAAKGYMGSVAWPTVAFTVAVVTAFIVHLTLFALGMIPAWLALVLTAALTYMSYTPLHEAAHGNINGTEESRQWLNDLCGYLVAPIIFLPYASHRHEHFTHHRFTNQADKDPDYVVSGLGKSFTTAVAAVFLFLWVQISFFARHHWHTSTLYERTVYCAELAVGIGWRVLFIVLIDQAGAALVILLGYLMGAFFTAYWFAYRPHLPYEETKRYRNTNSMIMPSWMKPLEWFWLGQNLHSIHHLFPKVPFYRYHALYNEIEPVLHAHSTPTIGVFSRESMIG